MGTQWEEPNGRQQGTPRRNPMGDPPNGRPPQWEAMGDPQKDPLWETPQEDPLWETPNVPPNGTEWGTPSGTPNGSH